jgi:hypothetical protein
MITREEILEEKNCPPELEENLSILLDKMNKLRTIYNIPMKVNSGLRTKEDQLRIYKEKGITDIKKIPMASKHFFCQAVDISDPEKKLQQWVKDNLRIIEEIGLWMEDFSYTPTWCHFQSVPPKSGNRFFKPW